MISHLDKVIRPVYCRPSQGIENANVNFESSRQDMMLLNEFPGDLLFI
jgi:hypothetical protein